jgi:hypothetical protein
MINRADLTYKIILDRVKQIYKENYQDDDLEIIERVFNDFIDLFSGKMKGFLKCDTGYHDIIHTLQVLYPFIGIIDGWNKSGKPPKISKDFFKIGIIAVLLHDTGYIKTEDDIHGTGGKYTFVHIQRSSDFAGDYLGRIGFDKDKITSIKNIIMYTGVVVDYNKLPSSSQEEKIVGFALGTADLLGQMSATDYLEKLPALYREFEEAYHHEGIQKLHEKGLTLFKNSDDLIKSTPNFYEVIVKDRLEKMDSVYTCLTHHFKDSRNHYIEAVEENIKKIKAFLKQ